MQQHNHPTARAALIAIAVLVLAACEQLAGPVQHPDSVLISASGLPTDVAHELTLTTPAGTPITVLVGERIEEAAPGEYRLSTTPIHYGNSTFTTTGSSIAGTLEAGKSLTLHARYGPDREILQGAVDRLNDYRRESGLAPVVGQPEESYPHWSHARYSVLNAATGHYQDPSYPWYSPEGHKAARESNLSYIVSWGRDPADGGARVDSFARHPYHMFHLMDPRATALRFGRYHPVPEENAWFVTAVMQPVKTAEWGNATVKFPGPNATATVAAFGAENPDPLVNCPGYDLTPTGLPIFVMTGLNNAPRIMSTTLTRNGAPIPHCAFDSHTDQNGSARMRHHGAIILIPRDPLRTNSTYDVRIVTDQRTHEWTFYTNDFLWAYPDEIDEPLPQHTQQQP